MIHSANDIIVVANHVVILHGKQANSTHTGKQSNYVIFCCFFSTLSRAAMNADKPTSINTRKPVTLCSLKDKVIARSKVKQMT